MNELNELDDKWKKNKEVTIDKMKSIDTFKSVQYDVVLVVLLITFVGKSCVSVTFLSHTIIGT